MNSDKIEVRNLFQIYGYSVMEKDNIIAALQKADGESNPEKSAVYK